MPEIEAGLDGSFSVEEDAIESAKVEAAQRELAEEQAAAEGEGLILGKFQTTEDLAKAYQSLQAEFTKSKQGKGQTEQAQEEPAQPENASKPDQPAQNSKQDKPAWSPEQAAQVEKALLDQLGGQEKYQALRGWANAQLDEAGKNAYNEAINSGDVNRALTAVKSLQFDYLMANGMEPKLLSGRPASEEPKGFSSEAQVVAAMSDPRYMQGADHDPAYVAEVERRLAISNVFATR